MQLDHERDKNRLRLLRQMLPAFLLMRLSEPFRCFNMVTSPVTKERQLSERIDMANRGDMRTVTSSHLTDTARWEVRGFQRIRHRGRNLSSAGRVPQSIRIQGERGSSGPENNRIGAASIPSACFRNSPHVQLMYLETVPHGTSQRKTGKGLLKSGSLCNFLAAGRG